MKKNNLHVYIQLAILFGLIALIFLASAITYSSGVIEEEPFLSEDENSPYYYRKVLDTEEHSFACIVGYDGYVCSHFPNATIHMVGDWSDMVSRVNYGREDALTVEESSLPFVLETMPNLRAFETPIEISEYCFMTAKTEAGNQLCDELDAFIKQCEENGEKDRLINKWMENDLQSFPMEEVVFSENATILRIPIDADWLPMSFISNLDEGAVGYFIDFLNLFCVQNGYRPEYVATSSLDACVMGLATGKYDIGAIGMIWSEERSERYNMSLPVVDDPIYVCVRHSSVIGFDKNEHLKKNTFFDYLLDILARNLAEQGRYIMLLRGMGTTILIALSSTILGTVIGALIYCLRRSNHLFWSSVGRLYINIFQRMPKVLLLLILFYVVFTSKGFPAILVCVISFAISFSPTMAELLRSGVESIPEGQWKAALALGFTKPQTFKKIILPQVLTIILPVYKGDVIALFMDTSIAGYVSVHDLTHVSEFIRSSTLEALPSMLVTAVIYFALTLIIGLFLDWVLKKINPKGRRIVLIK